MNTQTKYIKGPLKLYNSLWLQPLSGEISSHNYKSSWKTLQINMRILCEYAVINSQS